MTYRKNGINPLLISIVTKKELSEIPPSPPESMLPGLYAKQVRKNAGSISKRLPKNKYKLVCAACERGGNYDVGLIVLDMDKYRLNKDDKNYYAWEDAFQFTGYFRCRHCNAAGDWQFPNITKTMLQFSILNIILDEKIGKKSERTVAGRLLTFDDRAFHWTSEAESHYLNTLMQKPDDAWVWNRLGNMYNKGGRPDLAVVAYEESIKHDLNQVESHFTLGKILFELGAGDAAMQHLRKALLSARDYHHMEPLELRDMLTDALFTMFDIVEDVEKFIALLPKGDEFENKKNNSKKQAALEFTDIEVSFDGPEGMYPLAELYMGNLHKQIPLEERTYFPPQMDINHRNKKKKKKKKRRK